MMADLVVTGGMAKRAGVMPGQGVVLTGLFGEFAAQLLLE